MKWFGLVGALTFVVTHGYGEVEPDSHWVNDLRLAVGSMPEVELSENVRNKTTDARSRRSATLSDSRWRIELQKFGTFASAYESGAFVLGAILAYSNLDAEGDGFTVVTRTPSFDVCAGYAWIPASLPQAHIEITPFLGYGTTDFDIQNGLGRYLGYSGTLEFGIRGGAFWAFANGVQLGIDLRYIDVDVRRKDIEIEGTPAYDGEIEFSSSGFSVLGTVGYKF